MINIAVLITCFNRKIKTCSCLDKLYVAINRYNSINTDKVLSVEVFLVNDGCTDGTVEAVQTEFLDKTIHIIQGNGTLFWAGGMRLAWSEAYKNHEKWDFYLLLNDDTDVFPDAFIQLMNTHEYSIKQYGKSGIYSGATCAKDNNEVYTYGGSVWINRLKGLSKYVIPNGIPQMCDLTNANILLVSSNIIKQIGMFSKDYQHGMADYDYAVRARKHDIPVLLTSFYSGACDNDHIESKILAQRICAMTLEERKRYFKHPIHSNRDYLRFIRNISPIRLPLVWIGRMLNLYLPQFYYWLSGVR